VVWAQQPELVVEQLPEQNRRLVQPPRGLQHSPQAVAGDERVVVVGTEHLHLHLHLHLLGAQFLELRDRLIQLPGGLVHPAGGLEEPDEALAGDLVHVDIKKLGRPQPVMGQAIPAAPCVRSSTRYATSSAAGKKTRLKMK